MHFITGNHSRGRNNYNYTIINFMSPYIITIIPKEANPSQSSPKKHTSTTSGYIADSNIIIDSPAIPPRLQFCFAQRTRRRQQPRSAALHPALRHAFGVNSRGNHAAARSHLHAFSVEDVAARQRRRLLSLLHRAQAHAALAAVSLHAVKQRSTDTSNAINFATRLPSHAKKSWVGAVT